MTATHPKLLVLSIALLPFSLCAAEETVQRHNLEKLLSRNLDKIIERPPANVKPSDWKAQWTEVRDDLRLFTVEIRRETEDDVTAPKTSVASRS